MEKKKVEPWEIPNWRFISFYKGRVIEDVRIMEEPDSKIIILHLNNGGSIHLHQNKWGKEQGTRTKDKIFKNDLAELQREKK